MKIIPTIVLWIVRDTPYSLERGSRRVGCVRNGVVFVVDYRVAHRECFNRYIGVGKANGGIREMVRMSDLALVWKVPKDPDIDVGEYMENGIFPTGELMAVCPSKEVARQHRAYLREHSPSDRFDEQPYEFKISYRDMVDDTMPWINTGRNHD